MIKCKCGREAEFKDCDVILSFTFPSKNGFTTHTFGDRILFRGDICVKCFDDLNDVILEHTNKWCEENGFSI